MLETSKKQYDILIAGAGFAGSITALILHNLGLKVCLIEKGQHPRFAIGESSTPVADLILRNLATKYNLPWLHDFSRYGTWQQSHPEIICGIKRGFSFYKHSPGKKFVTSEGHINELLVAASSDDIQSDTNWLRADLDAFLVNKVKEYGIDYFDLTEIVSAKKNAKWDFYVNHLNSHSIMEVAYYIDATGSGDLLEKLLGIKSSSADFLTNSFSIFSHFNHLPTWSGILQKENIPSDDYPYNPDNSALHHVLDEGWIWMLRFNNNLTSFGFVLEDSNALYDNIETEIIWEEKLKKYPSVNNLMTEATLAEKPGKILRSKRLQRKLNNCFGSGWVALPHSIGFIDPLFSSGIAHSLAGIEKVINCISENWGDERKLDQNMKEYENAVFEELKLADCLIAGCYKSMPYFELFNIWSMLYFTATIAHEQRRIKKQEPGYFLNADDLAIREIVKLSYADLIKILENAPPTAEEINRFTRIIKERIQPYNIAGLLEPSSKNMYLHTVAKI